MNFPIEYFDDEVREGFYVPPIMKHCWAAQMEVVKTVDEICKKNNINYYLFSGTLMGAVRHGGYIPWDDDVDICMLRRDYQKFIKVAPHYMPERYYIRNIHTHSDYRQCFTRFSNDDAIGVNEEFWEKGHGFLCNAGIDIFPLDYIPEDPERLDKVLYDTHFLYTVAMNYDEKGLDGLVREQIKDVEREFKVTINLEKNIGQQMFVIMEDIFRNIKSYEGKKVHIPMFWMEHPEIGIPVSAFENAMDYTFENTTFKVPYLYDEVLSSMYGAYMNPVRVCDIHSYPWYKDVLAEMQNINFEPDYKFDINALPLSNRHEIWENSYMKELNETVELFSKASALAEQSFAAGDVESGKVLMEKCNSLAKNAERIEKSLRGTGRERVVFLTWKAEYWSSFEPYYLNEIESGAEVFVIPVPFVRMTELRKISDEFIEKDGFPEYVELTDYASFDFTEYRIDRIYIQNQYDDMNGATRIDSRFYSSSLQQVCDELIYVPWFKLDEYGKDDERAIYMMKYFLFMPGIIASDSVYLTEKWFRECCIRELSNWAGEETTEIWENKICLVEFTDDCRKEQEVDADKKKTLLYYIGTGQILSATDKMLEKMTSNLASFDDSKDKLSIKLVLEEGLKYNVSKFKPSITGKLDDILNIYQEKEWCEYIGEESICVTDNNIKELVGLCDAFYGDAGVIMHLFNRAKKPVMQQTVGK